MEDRQLLLVDHDLTSLERMGSALKGAGFDVTALNSDEWGLLVMQNKRFDLVVADIFADETTGIHFPQTIKRSSPDTMVILLPPRQNSTQP